MNFDRKTENFPLWSNAMEKIAECQKSQGRLQVEAALYPQVYENLARQRYNTEQLGKFLEDKRKALREGDCQLADRLESGIARLAESIALLRDELLPLLDGRTVLDFSASFPEHMRGPLAGLTAEMSRLEWLCLKELNGIRQILRNGGGAGVHREDFARQGGRSHATTRTNG
jgi:hypothetical protein